MSGICQPGVRRLCCSWICSLPILDIQSECCNSHLTAVWLGGICEAEAHTPNMIARSNCLVLSNYLHGIYFINLWLHGLHNEFLSSSSTNCSAWGVCIHCNHWHGLEYCFGFVHVLWLCSLCILYQFSQNEYKSKKKSTNFLWPHSWILAWTKSTLIRFHLKIYRPDYYYYYIFLLLFSWIFRNSFWFSG